VSGIFKKVSYQECKDCGCWGFTDTHRCPPMWEIEPAWVIRRRDQPDEVTWEEEELQTVSGTDEEEALEHWAERFDGEGDHTIVRGSERLVRIREKGKQEWKEYTVSGELVAQYSVREVKS
jgi:hypothetical protein